MYMFGYRYWTHFIYDYSKLTHTHTHTHIYIYILYIYRERERESEKQTDRQTETETDRQTDFIFIILKIENFINLCDLKNLARFIKKKAHCMPSGKGLRLHPSKKKVSYIWQLAPFHGELHRQGTTTQKKYDERDSLTSSYRITLKE